MTELIELLYAAAENELCDSSVAAEFYCLAEQLEKQELQG